MNEITIDDNNFANVLVTKDPEDKQKVVVDFILTDDTTITIKLPFTDIYRTLEGFPPNEENKKTLMSMDIHGTKLNIRGAIFLNALAEAKEKAES